MEMAPFAGKDLMAERPIKYLPAKEPYEITPTAQRFSSTSDVMEFPYTRICLDGIPLPINRYIHKPAF
jgi:hypothetical protein